nr:hypothetical protein EUGRSUZ_E03237 [Ipomoea batatas]
MSPCGEDEEHETTQQTKPNRNHIQHLLRFMVRLRIQTAHHILIPQRDRHENQHRENCVHVVDESRPELPQVGAGGDPGDRRRLGVEEPQASARGEAVVDLAVTRADAIGVSSWKARSVPVGRRLARCAVLSKARCDNDGCGGGKVAAGRRGSGTDNVSISRSSTTGAVDVDVVVRDLRLLDIIAE